MNTDDLDRQAQAEAERAERTNAAARGDPRVDRYRLIVRALRRPLPLLLPADFAVRVAATAALTQRDDGVEDWIVVLLLFALGVGAMIFVVPTLANYAQALVSVRLPAVPWRELAMAVVCIGVVWAMDSGWSHLRPCTRKR